MKQDEKLTLQAEIDSLQIELEESFGKPVHVLEQIRRDMDNKKLKLQAADFNFSKAEYHPTISTPHTRNFRYSRT